MLTMRNKLDWASLAAMAILWVACFPAHALAQQSGQKLFASPEEAAKALVSAAQSNDEGELLKILGPDAQRIVSSGDPAEDTDSRANFARKYNEMHRFVKEPDGTTVLYLGAENWPTPIPLVIATIFTMPKPKSNHHAALLAIEKVLTLLRSVQTLEGTDKDGVEHLLEMAVENLKK